MEVEIRDHNLMSGQFWHKKGDPNYYHREDGPAVIHNDGREYWWYYDLSYTNEYKKMPLNLFLAYCKWEYRKNGS